MKKILVLSLIVISIITTSGCSTTKSKDQTKVDSKATVSTNVEEKKNEQDSESKDNAELSQSKADANTSGTQNSEKATAGKTETKTETKTNNEEVVSYKNYKNGRYLFSLDYPSEYKVQESSTNGDGAIISWENAKITVFGSNNVLNYNVQSYFDAIAKDIKEEIKYKSINNNSFIISYESGESIVYSKYVIGSGSINTFVFTYPKEKANQYQKVAERINSSFKTPGIDDAH